MNLKRGWFSGRIVPCHGTDPGSIPGSRTTFGYLEAGQDARDHSMKSFETRLV